MVRASSVGSASVCGEHDPQPVMIEVLEAVSQTTDLFDDQIDGFGAAVGNPRSIEVGHHLGPPGAEGAAQSGNLGDGAAVEAVEHLGRDLTALRWGGVVDGAELLVALPGQVHLICGVAGVEAVADLGLLAFGEVFYAVAE